MSLNFSQLFGANANYTSGTVSFNINDLVDEEGRSLLTSVPDSEPSDLEDSVAAEKVMVALLMFQAITAKPVRDENGTDITPADQGIVYEDQTFFTGRTFVVREEIEQIEHTITVKAYTPDNTGLDADEVV